MPFRWLTNDDRELLPSELDTLHLFHSVRMLWNHTVPAKHHLTPFRQWVLRLDADERAEAMREMLAQFIEVQDATMAQSIRANWKPEWGKDPGKPDTIYLDGAESP